MECSDKDLELMELRLKKKRVDAAKSEMELNRLKFLNKASKLEYEIGLSQATLDKIDKQIKESETQGE